MFDFHMLIFLSLSLPSSLFLPLSYHLSLPVTPPRVDHVRSAAVLTTVTAQSATSVGTLCLVLLPSGSTSDQTVIEVSMCIWYMYIHVYVH